MPYAMVPFEFLSYAFQNGMLLLTYKDTSVYNSLQADSLKERMLIFLKMLVNFQIPLKGNERIIY